MKTLTIRIPDALSAEIEAESRGRKLSKSDVVRERLSARSGARRGRLVRYDAIADLVGSVKGLPHDLSTHKKQHLKVMGYGKKRSR